MKEREEEALSPVPVAQFTRYFSRKGRRGAKSAKGRKEEENDNLTLNEILSFMAHFESFY